MKSIIDFLELMKINNFQYNIILSRNDDAFIERMSDSDFKYFINNSVFVKDNFNSIVNLVSIKKLSCIGGEFYKIFNNKIEHTNDYWDKYFEISDYLKANPSTDILIKFVIN